MTRHRSRGITKLIFFAKEASQTGTPDISLVALPLMEGLLLLIISSSHHPCSLQRISIYQ